MNEPGAGALGEAPRELIEQLVRLAGRVLEAKPQGFHLLLCAPGAESGTTARMHAGEDPAQAANLAESPAHHRDAARRREQGSATKCLPEEDAALLVARSKRRKTQPAYSGERIREPLVLLPHGPAALRPIAFGEVDRLSSVNAKGETPPSAELDRFDANQRTRRDFDSMLEEPGASCFPVGEDLAAGEAGAAWGQGGSAGHARHLVGNPPPRGPRSGRPPLPCHDQETVSRGR